MIFYMTTPINYLLHIGPKRRERLQEYMVDTG